MGLIISIINKCDECIMYHLQGCLKEKVAKEEIIEAIKLAVIGGGSVTYPSTRFAFSTMRELKII